MSAPTDEVDCPYVGLAPFEEAHAAYFFGRTLDSSVLADNVLGRRVTVLYGASGVGKSSMLNVGLPRALAELGVVVQIVARREWHEPESLGVWLENAIHEVQAARPLVLILDQFEEYFLYPDAEQVRAFGKSLAALVAHKKIEAHLLFALRDDGLHRLDALRVHLPGLLDTTLELRHLDGRAVREAIEQPIVAWNTRHERQVVLDSDFAEALIAQLRPKDKENEPIGGGRVELAYLQLALERIWDAEGGMQATALRTSTLTERLKGISEISRRHVEEVLAELPEGDQALCATVFDRLVTPSGGKILYTRSDLAVVAKVTPKRIDEVLAPLASGKNRLLRAVELPAGKDSRGYEILHDILARPILDWKEARVAKLETKVERERADAEAEARHRAESDRARLARMRNLLVGLMALLLCALGVAGWAAWNANRQTALARAENQRAIAAKAAAEAAAQEAKLAKDAGEQQRLLAEEQRAKAVSALDAATEARKSAARALKSAKASSKEAVSERAKAEKNYKEARSRELATLADTKLGRGGELGVLLALEARAASATPHAEQVLRRGVSEWTGVELARLANGVRSFALSPSRKELAAIDGDGKVWLLNYDAAGPARELKVVQEKYGIPDRLTYDQSGRLLAVGWSDGLIQIWPTSGSAPTHEWKTHSTSVRALCFTPDGRYIVSASEDPKIKARDLQSGFVLEIDVGNTFSARLQCGPRSSADLVSVSEYEGGAGRTVVWRLTSPTPEIVFKWADKEAAFDTDGHLIVSGPDGLELLDTETGRPVGKLDDVGGVFDPVVSVDGRFMTAKSETKGIVWSLSGSSAGHVVSTVELPERVRSVGLSLDGESLISVDDEGVVRTMPIGRKITTRELVSRSSLGDGQVRKTLATAATAGVAAIVSPDQRVSLWTVGEGHVNRLQIDTGEKQKQPDLLAISLGEKGKALFVQRLGQITAWSTKSENAPRTLQIHALGYTFVIDEKGRFLGSGENCAGSCLWSLQSGKPEREMYPINRRVEPQAVSRRGHYMLVAEQTGSRLWELDSGTSKPVPSIPWRYSGTATFLADRDGRFLLSGRYDRVTKWNIEDGYSVWEKALGQTANLAAVALSPNGECAAVAGGYPGRGFGWILDADSGTKLQELWGHRGEITSIAFSDDSQNLLTVSQDGTAREFPISTCGSEESLARLARERVKRSLTEEEKRRYLGE